jgi:lipid-A-disaccharide synthase
MGLEGGSSKLWTVRVFISAGEASGDLYASRVVEALRARHPDTEFFGCAGPRMQAAGVRTVVDSRSLAVAGLVEVIPHIPRIWREFRKLCRSFSDTRPDVAVLTDSPDFHLRLAKKLKAKGIPVVYLIAPQAWAWRQGRVRTMRATIQRLLCIFPFEEEFFRSHGVRASFIGHPLAGIVRPSMSREEFLLRLVSGRSGTCPAENGRSGTCPAENGRSGTCPTTSTIITLLPGSRHGEVARHLPYLLDAARRISTTHSATFILALPPGFGYDQSEIRHTVKFWERNEGASIQVMEGMTWDALAYSDLALAASGTVTVEAALLGTPMVTFYRVNALSWLLGRWLVRAPFLSMVNLVAGRRVAPELIQGEMTGERIAAEAVRLLDDEGAREEMRAGLREVKGKLTSGGDPMEAAAEWIEKVFSESKQNVQV